jgi:hypothetical protein
VIGTAGILEYSFRVGHLVDLRGAYLRLIDNGVHLDRGLLNRRLAAFLLPPI